MTPERKLKRDARPFAESRGILVYTLRGPGQRGVPDWVLIFPGGEVAFVEFKRPDGRGVLSRIQGRKIHAIQAQGALVYVCSTFEAFEAIVRENLDRGPDRSN